MFTVYNLFHYNFLRNSLMFPPLEANWKSAHKLDGSFIFDLHAIIFFCRTGAKLAHIANNEHLHQHHSIAITYKLQEKSMKILMHHNSFQKSP